VTLGRRALTLVGLALAMGAVAGPLLAHSELRESYPVDGQTMRTAIDRVELVFWSAFTDPQIDVTGPQGAPIPGRTSQADEVTARFDMEPLGEEGVYLVSYQIRSVDRYLSVGEIEFAYNPDPGRPLGLAPILGVLIGAAALVAVRRVARGRNKTQ